MHIFRDELSCVLSLLSNGWAILASISSDQRGKRVRKVASAWNSGGSRNRTSQRGRLLPIHSQPLRHKANRQK